MSATEIIRPNDAATVKLETGQEISANRELATAYDAAQAKAEIEARIIQALNRRRSVKQFRVDLLEDCKRPRFAEVALYMKPTGGNHQDSTGKWVPNVAIDFSIRFIEDALEHYGNFESVSSVVWETASQVKLRVRVSDIQNNSHHTTEVVIDKLVERKKLLPGRQPYSSRANTSGDTVYLYEATKDEVRNLVGAERSKLLRDNGKRLLPRDVLDECRDQIEATLADPKAEDPGAQINRMFDKFRALGVSPAMIAEYLKHDADSILPAELTVLRGIYQAINEGATTWAEFIAAAKSAGEDSAADAEPPKAKTGSAKDRVMAHPGFTEKPKE